MRFFLRLFLIAGLTYLLGWQLPQWPVWPVAVGAGLIGFLLAQAQKRSIFSRRKPPRAYAFGAGFLGAGVVWGLLSWRIDQANEGRLSEMIAELLLQDPSLHWLLVLLTALVGGLLGGMGAMTGNFLGEAWRTR
jgi:hypothetical protein